MRHYFQRYARAVILAMIPLTFVGSMPRMGCICANGDHKVFCERHRQTATDGSCACCHGHDRSAAKPGPDGSSPSASKSCCGTSCATHGKFRGQSVGTECPCRPVLDVPQLLTAEKSNHGIDLTGYCLPGLQVSVPQIVSRPTAYDVSRNRDLPPPDLVIVHQAFLI